MPLFTEVIELTDRGFGFAASAAGQRLFFHRSAGLRPSHFEALKRHDKILAIVGSDPRRPRSKEIVRWAASDRITWDDDAPKDQASWDEIRRAWLVKRLQPQGSILRPDWYVHKWESKPAPADLQDDLLHELVLARIASMDSDELERLDLLNLSGSALYSFAPCLDRAHPDAVVLLDHVPAERLPLFGPPGPRVLARASEARRAEVVSWFVRAGGAEAHAEERDAMLTGRAPWEAEAASRLLASGPPQGAGHVRWLRALRKEGLLPEGFADEAAEADGVQALCYAELLSEKVRDALLCEAAAKDKSRVEAVALRPDLAADLLGRSAVAFDLETDGRRTRQIGIARVSGSRLLLDGGGTEEQAEAFAALSCGLSEGSIVVGQNVLAWDLAVLRQEGIDPLATGLVWDTLLVETLLNPRAVSHALGGTHRADMDAAHALALFQRQLDYLPDSFAASSTGSASTSGRSTMPCASASWCQSRHSSVSRTTTPPMRDARFRCSPRLT
ncbi:hypothetical protein GI374_07040 [Paracoccus sp. S-4012]|uniref:hypothetical protein n=1 Tax=Paracoccus sp. S-4012 TaxID=2665648 RepID=UPI0012B08A7A|nr:hypothetical protein [Paracoccus sp. S-4012]MRX50204.1 hypothetical protein [Paracoccus sp. S-4012]